MAKDKKKNGESKKEKSEKKGKALIAPGITPGEADAPKKKSPKAKAKPAAAKKKADALVEISFEDISLRAYYIAERRNALGHHGNEHDDWHEAERQLRQEAKKKKS